MRPSRYQMFLAMARAASMRATCYRLNVGCVVVFEQSVVGTGYNGSPPGYEHCSGNGCPYFKPTGCEVIHAEINAMRRARHAVSAHADVQLYVTHSPCGECTRAILEQRYDLGVTAVYYETAYRDPAPVRELIAGGVDVFRVLPSGMMVDESTGALCAP